jgi:hypothetical protein
MTAAAQRRAVARYGLAWTAELCDWLIRMSAWRVVRRYTPRDDPRRRELLEVLDYLRAARPDVTERN